MFSNLFYFLLEAQQNMMEEVDFLPKNTFPNDKFSLVYFMLWLICISTLLMMMENQQLMSHHFLTQTVSFLLGRTQDV